MASLNASLDPEILGLLTRDELDRVYTALADEEFRRENGKRLAKHQPSFLEWCEYALKPFGQRPAAHHRLFIDELQGIADGETEREMFFAPPGCAKTTYVTKLFAPYLFNRFPGCQVIGASHTAPLARRFSGEIQRLVTQNQDWLGFSLRTDNKEWWDTTNGCSYRAVGVGAAIPGTRADFVVVDDPIRGREDADSEVKRDSVWAWFNGDLDFRRKPSAPIVLMHTRWSLDDLAGRLLQTEPEKWRVLTLRAEAEEGDPLGRKLGELLWEDNDGYDYPGWLRSERESLEARGATREWASQFQQRPTPAGGIIFKVDRIGVLEAIPAGGKTVRAYDLASTRKTGSRDPDWTRGVKLTLLPNKRLVVEHVASCRGTPDDVERLIVNTAGVDGKRVKIGIPQDPGQAGVAQVAYYAKLLHGYMVVSSPETGDKMTRANPIASQVNVGNVDIVAGQWNRAFLDELETAGAGAHDDQIDALSRAYSMLVEAGRPLILPPAMISSMNQLPNRNRFAPMQRNRFARAR